MRSTEYHEIISEAGSHKRSAVQGPLLYPSTARVSLSCILRKMIIVMEYQRDTSFVADTAVCPFWVNMTLLRASANQISAGRLNKAMLM